ncbi:MAG: indolepyruvate oxidoreductase subunit beta [Tissierellia bacterium]|jgi:indolepyruvate ferredoxin oxidoreductase beta subunit|nr:indolepyruvate oxidoreductase subunit beta [Tissierellia bacterium]
METKNIMIVGVGGQGTLLTSRILGGVILDSGWDVKLSEVHGMAQRGGSVVTFVRYGEKVYEPIVEEGKADILISFERLEALRYKHFLKKDGIMIVNDQRIDPMSVIIKKEKYPEDIVENLRKDFDLIVVDALEEARKIGNLKVFNVIVLGVLSKYMNIDDEVWIKQIKENVPEYSIEENLIAFQVGKDYKEEIV